MRFPRCVHGLGIHRQRQPWGLRDILGLGGLLDFAVDRGDISRRWYG